MTKSYSLEEGLQVAVEYTNQIVVEKGLVFAIGATDVESVKEALEKHAYTMVGNEMGLIQNITESEADVVYVSTEAGDKKYDEFNAKIRQLAKEHDKNVFVLVELPKRIENRYAERSDFQGHLEQDAAMIFGVTNAGTNLVKNRFGKLGIVSENELFSL